MGSKVEVPPPTPEENALRAEQTNLLKQQRILLEQQQSEQRALLPLFAQQMGLNIEFDESGKIIGATEDPQFAALSDLQRQVMEQSLGKLLSDAELDPQRKEIERMLLERSGKALRGELEIDPALERDIGNQRETLMERLRGQLGSGFETSSPGIEAIQKFEESANVLRSQARRGELTLAEQLSMAREGMGQGKATQGIQTGQQLLSQIFGAQAQTGNLSSVLGIAGGLGQNAAGYEMPIGQLANYRQQQLDANIANARNEMGILGGIGQLFGSVIGAIPFSDRRLKSSIEALGVWLFEGVQLYAFDIMGTRRIGVMAQDVMSVRPEAVVLMPNGYLGVNYGAL